MSLLNHYHHQQQQLPQLPQLQHQQLPNPYVNYMIPNNNNNNNNNNDSNNPMPITVNHSNNSAAPSYYEQVNRHHLVYNSTTTTSGDGRGIKRRFSQLESTEPDHSPISHAHKFPKSSTTTMATMNMTMTTTNSVSELMAPLRYYNHNNNNNNNYFNNNNNNNNNNHGESMLCLDHDWLTNDMTNNTCSIQSHSAPLNMTAAVNCQQHQHQHPSMTMMMPSSTLNPIEDQVIHFDSDLLELPPFFDDEVVNNTYYGGGSREQQHQQYHHQPLHEHEAFQLEDVMRQDEEHSFMSSVLPPLGDDCAQIADNGGQPRYMSLFMPKFRAIGGVGDESESENENENDNDESDREEENDEYSGDDNDEEDEYRITSSYKSSVSTGPPHVLSETIITCTSTPSSALADHSDHDDCSNDCSIVNDHHHHHSSVNMNDAKRKKKRKQSGGGGGGKSAKSKKLRGTVMSSEVKKTKKHNTTIKQEYDDESHDDHSDYDDRNHAADDDDADDEYFAPVVVPTNDHQPHDHGDYSRVGTTTTIATASNNASTDGASASDAEQIRNGFMHTESMPSPIKKELTPSERNSIITSQLSQLVGSPHHIAFMILSPERNRHRTFDIPRKDIMSRCTADDPVLKIGSGSEKKFKYFLHVLFLSKQARVPRLDLVKEHEHAPIPKALKIHQAQLLSHGMIARYSLSFMVNSFEHERKSFHLVCTNTESGESLTKSVPFKLNARKTSDCLFHLKTSTAGSTTNGKKQKRKTSSRSAESHHSDQD